MCKKRENDMCKKRDNDTCNKNKGEKVKEGYFHTPVTPMRTLGFQRRESVVVGLQIK